MRVRDATSVAIVVMTTFVAMLLSASPALAFDETTSTMVFSGCATCHTTWPTVTPDAVHGGYTTTSKNCQTCHSVHAANAKGQMLLPAATITDDCNTCHDGTGGQGVYGVVKARLGVTPVAGHRTETTTVIPGGNSASGGNVSRVFQGVGGTLTCTDCHSPHGADVVTAFQADRIRTSGGPTANPTSTKLLKRRPTGSPASVSEYGSDWCLTCHAGRVSGGVVHNHPAESSATVAMPRNYGHTAILSTTTVPTNSTTLGGMGGTNAGYLMPFPRTSGVNGQAGHLPICQQCHADARNPGTLDAAGAAQAAAYAVSTPQYGVADGRVSTDNPRFQVFPHESTSTAMLIQQNDDLCLNCHPTGQLP